MIVKFKKILVPFDFNENFDNTFKVAEEMALKSGAELTVLSIINPISAAGKDFFVNCTTPLVEYKSAIEERESAISIYLEKSILSDKQLMIKVEVGYYNSTIIQLNKLSPFDLIVLPDFHKTPMDRLIEEINALEIMEKTKLPVIAVNKFMGGFNLKRVVLPIRNITNWFHKVPIVTSLAKLTGARIYVIGLANSTSKSAIRKVEDKLSYCANFLRKHQVRFELDRVYCHGEPCYDVISLARYRRADLIAVTPPVEYNKMKSYFNTNFYNKLITKGNTPILGITLA